MGMGYIQHICLFTAFCKKACYGFSLSGFLLPRLVRNCEATVRLKYILAGRLSHGSPSPKSWELGSIYPIVT